MTIPLKIRKKKEQRGIAYLDLKKSLPKSQMKNQVRAVRSKFAEP